MAINFPSSPSLYDVFTVNERAWRWDGTTWRAIGTQLGGAQPVNDGATVYRAAAAQTVTTSTNTVVTFDTEVRDDNGYANLGTNNDRFTIPHSGWYIVTGYVNWAGASGGRRQAWIQKNGDTNTRFGYSTIDSTVSTALRSTAEAAEYFEVGDYVQLAVYHDYGSDIDLSLFADGPRLSIHRLGIASSPANPINDGAAVARTTSQNIADAADVAISWETEVRDDGGYFSSGSPTRLTIANSGWYALIGYVRWDSNTTGGRNLWWRKNGSTIIAGRNARGTAMAYLSQDATAVVYLVAGDYVELVVRQSSTNVRTIDVTFDPATAQIHRLGTPPQAALPAGGMTGQALVKASDTDGDVEWVDNTSFPDTVAEFFDDFLYHANSTYYQNANTWRPLASSSNTHTNIAAVAGHPGVIRATNANTASGAYTIYCLTSDQNSGTWNQWMINGNNALIFETSARVSGLPSSANNLSYRFGLQNINNATHFLNFFLHWNGSATEWYIANAAGGTSASTINTANLPTANTWFKLKIIATSTQALYYVDDVLVATHTTYLPTDPLTAYFTTVRGATGDASRTMDIDYCLIRQNFPAGRPA